MPPPLLDPSLLSISPTYTCFRLKWCYSYFFFFFFNDPATTEIYTLSLHDALPICAAHADGRGSGLRRDRIDVRLARARQRPVSIHHVWAGRLHPRVGLVMAGAQIRRGGAARAAVMARTKNGGPGPARRVTLFRHRQFIVRCRGSPHRGRHGNRAGRPAPREF